MIVPSVLLNNDDENFKLNGDNGKVYLVVNEIDIFCGLFTIALLCSNEAICMNNLIFLLDAWTHTLNGEQPSHGNLGFNNIECN